MKTKYVNEKSSLLNNDARKLAKNGIRLVTETKSGFFSTAIDKLFKKSDELIENGKENNSPNIDRSGYTEIKSHQGYQR